MKQGMDWEQHYISIDEVLQRDDVRARVDVDASLETGNTAARYLPLKNGSGEVGFIMPMSERFCEGCPALMSACRSSTELARSDPQWWQR